MENVTRVKKIELKTPKGYSIDFINNVKRYMCNNHYELYDDVVTHKHKIVIKFMYSYEEYDSLLTIITDMYNLDREGR